MQHDLVRYPANSLLQVAITLLAAVFCAMLFPGKAEANVVCLMDNAAMDFGTSSVGSGTIDYTCTNYSTTPRSFALCVDRGRPSWPGSRSQPVLRSGGFFVDYQVYEDPALSQPWTPAQPLTTTVVIPGGIGTSVSGSVPFYGAILPNQSPTPGSYTAFFYNAELGTLNNGGQCQSNANVGFSFSGQRFTLSILATLVNECQIIALGNADLGAVSAGAGSASGIASISVNCPNGTAYNIGLQPSNGDVAGLGEMTGTTGNGDVLLYQLRSASPTGPIWGDTASVSSVGNGVTGTGTGFDQNYPVHVTVPDTNVTPDSYRDTVRVTVHF